MLALNLIPNMVKHQRLPERKTKKAHNVGLGIVPPKHNGRFLRLSQSTHTSASATQPNQSHQYK